MIIPEIKIYEGDDLAGPVLDVMFVNGINGSIKEILLIVGGNVTSGAVFNITKNGIALFTGSDRLTIAGGTNNVAKSGLSITVTETDVLQLDLEECGSEGVTAPITLILKVDDGASGGLSVEEIQDMIAAFLVAGSNVNLAYNDAGDQLVISSTDTNTQLTTEQVQDIVGAFIHGGTNVTVAYDDAANTLTISSTGGGGYPPGGTTGQALVKASDADNDVQWNDVATGSQSGAIFNADSPPVSANAEDDEFLPENFTLDPKWTRTQIGTITEESINERIQSTYFVRLAPGGGLHLTQPFAPGSSDFSITLAGYLVPTANFHNVSFGVKDGANAVLGVPGATGVNNYLQFSFEYAGSAGVAQFGVNKRVSGTDSFVVYGQTVTDINYSKSYLHLQRVGGVFEGYYSNNGTAWKKLFDAYSQPFTVSHLELVFETYGAATKTQGGFDWVRRDWLFL